MSSTVFNAVYMTVDAPVWLAVTEAVNEVGLWDVNGAVWTAVGRAVNQAVWRAVYWAMGRAVDGAADVAVWRAVEDPEQSSLQDFLREVL